MAEWCWRKQWFFFFPAFSLSSISVLASSLFFLPFYSLFCFYFSSIYQQCSTLSVVAPWWCCYSRWFTVVASQWQMTVRDGFSPVHFWYSCYSPGVLSSFFFFCFCSLSFWFKNQSLPLCFFVLPPFLFGSFFFFFLFSPLPLFVFASFTQNFSTSPSFPPLFFNSGFSSPKSRLFSSLYVLFFFFVSSLSSFSLFLPLFLLSISLVHPKSSLQPPLPRF